MLFRPANIAYILHLCLTFYSELLYSYSFIQLTNIIGKMEKLPGQPIWDNLFDQDDLKFASREARQEY